MPRITVAFSFLLLAVAAVAAPKDGMLNVGVVSYVPTLEEVRKRLIDDGHGPLVDDNKRSLFVSFRAPDPKRPDLWVEAFYMKYGGESEDRGFEIDVHNLGLSYLVLVPSEYVVPTLGVGGNILYMRRHEDLTFLDDITHNDWLWGLNAQAGLCIAPLPWIGVEASYLYQWSRQSTLGGTEYDLGDGTVALSVALMF